MIRQTFSSVMIVTTIVRALNVDEIAAVPGAAPPQVCGLEVAGRCHQWNELGMPDFYRYVVDVAQGKHAW
jgi:hypothetical protein